MQIAISEFQCREVINVASGKRLGEIMDMVIETESGRVLSITVPGTTRFFSFFRRREEIIIPWEKITKIGEDVILVNLDDV